MDRVGNTLLHQAVQQQKSRDYIQTLMEEGADYKTRNQKGERPIDLASKETKLFMEQYHKTLKHLTMKKLEGRIAHLEQSITALEKSGQQFSSRKF